MKHVLTCICLLFVLMLMPASTIQGCTNFLITKGASVDGSVMITYAADSHTFYGDLVLIPPGVHEEGTMIDVIEWDSGKYLGKIPQARRTYSVVGNMNEYQLSIGETTYGGRKELKNPDAILDYGSLMFLALQRTKTAREAILLIADLMEKYGYYSSGESLSIADKNEVWIMEIIGKGEGGKGANWVARRVPDGMICAHANQARIRQFPLNDSENCLYSDDVIEFAREKGYFTGKDKDFSFADAYAPLDYGALRFCEARVWAMFNRAAPSLNMSIDYVLARNEAGPMPLWIKPDKKISVHDVMEMMRDHFEGTELDMTKDVGAGPYSLPYRWRPLTWKVDDVEYCNERATSTQQTGFSFVSQLRSDFPDPIGGIHWFGVDDTSSTVYVPMYCGITQAPESFAHGNGSFHEFTMDAAFWVFNFVSNYAYLRYSDMIQDIQKVQRELEGKFIAEIPAIDSAALKLYGQSPRLAVDYLTQYSKTQGDYVTERWRKLGEFLIYKYLDGNVKNSLGEVTHPGYPEAWYQKVVDETGDHFKMKKLPGEESSH